MVRGFLRQWPTLASERAPRIRVDLTENESNYIVKAEVPGVRKEDIDVRIDGNQVTISAEVKKNEEEKKEGRVIRSERLHGFASRSFALGFDVDEGKSSAKYKDGVLELTLPKKTASSSRRLQIG